MNKGDIVILNFPFTDLSNKKIRPALVISNKKFNNSRNCILVGIYSSESLKDFSIKLEQEDLKEGKIKKTSFLRLQNIFTLEKRLIIKKIAELKTEKSDQVSSKLKYFIE